MPKGRLDITFAIFGYDCTVSENCFGSFLAEFNFLMKKFKKDFLILGSLYRGNRQPEKSA